MRSFVVRWMISAMSLWVGASLTAGVTFSGGGPPQFGDVLLVALVFGFVNAFIKPLLMFATCGLYVLTLGLFTFIMNALLLELTAWLSGGLLMVDGFGSAFQAALIISISSTVLTMILDPNDDEDDGRPRPPKRRGEEDVIVVYEDGRVG